MTATYNLYKILLINLSKRSDYNMYNIILDEDDDQQCSEIDRGNAH